MGLTLDDDLIDFFLFPPGMTAGVGEDILYLKTLNKALIIKFGFNDFIDWLVFD